MSNPEPPSSSQSEGRTERQGLFDRLRELFGLGAASIRDDIEEALDDESAGDADFSPKERSMLRNVLGLHEMRVGDVMVPRADIVGVALETSLADVLAVFRTEGHSRLPVYGETLDDPRGMVHIRDFVDYLASGAETALRSKTAIPPPPLDTSETRRSKLLQRAGYVGLDLTLSLARANILRPVLFAPPSMPVLDLLIKMQATRTHMALVIDEYGGTEGLASLEDIVEVIVGDIEDEHDISEAPKIEAATGGGFVADARAPLEDVSAAVGADLGALVEAEEVDTLGGFITAIAGRVPVRGEIIAIGGLEFEIVDADPRRLKRIRVHLRNAEPGEVAARDDTFGSTNLPAGGNAA